MRRSISLLSLTVAFLAVASFTSAQSVTTIPVGFTTSTIPAAPNGSTPSNAAISVPFYRPAEFTGAVGSVDSSNQLSISGATFTPSPSAGDLVTVPHLARLKTGASVGRFFIVTANTATQVTLDTATAGYTLTTGSPSTTQAQVVAGDSVEILPANTFGSLFGTSTVPFKTASTADVADNVYLFNGTSWDTYFHNGTNWRKNPGFTNQNNTVILPDRGLFIIRRDTTGPLNLTFLGTVPSTSERTDYPGPGSTFRSNRFPVDTTLLGLGLQTMPTWQSGSSAGAADNVYLWNGTTWSVFYYTGSIWRKSPAFNDQGATPIPAGTGIFVVRQSSAQGSASTLLQTLPYTLQ
jgi:uncharacterized protein (TIGR02597 family)